MIFFSRSLLNPKLLNTQKLYSKLQKNDMTKLKMLQILAINVVWQIFFPHSECGVYVNRARQFSPTLNRVLWGICG